MPEEPPLYEEVKNELDADEVVKAKDLELETGSIFEVEKDFTGLEIPDEKKVKITFHEAKNEEKQDFTTDYEDTYKAVLNCIFLMKTRKLWKAGHLVISPIM